MTGLLRHIAAAAAGVILLAGIPYLCSDDFKKRVSGTDAVTGASEALDAPSGEYVILINRDRHKNKEYLDIWEEFFSKGESERVFELFEDISCVTAAGDAGGLEMARTFQSRLAENQMKIRAEDGILMLSKAESGRYDVIVMSKEYYQRQHGDRIEEKTNALKTYFSDSTKKE